MVELSREEMIARAKARDESEVAALRSEIEKLQAEKAEAEEAVAALRKDLKEAIEEKEALLAAREERVRELQAEGEKTPPEGSAPAPKVEEKSSPKKTFKKAPQSPAKSTKVKKG